MKCTRWLVLMSIAALLGGCATTCGGDTTPFSPIRPSVNDKLTDTTAAQILAHNEIGARVYGWR